MPNGDTRAGISVYDVARLARQVERSYHVAVRWEYYLPMRADSGTALDVRCAARRRGGELGASNYERGSSGCFPGNSARTLAGLMYKLLWEVEQKLEEDKDEAERPQQGRLL